MTKNKYFQEWFSNPRRDVIAGTVVALALIPESLAFAIIAGVDPKVTLYASFCIAITIAFVGGRPGMISAATGAIALLIGSLVANHGVQYLLAATLLTGVLQILCGVFKLADLMRFVSKSVVTGFVNALAILYFITQAKEFVGQGWIMYAMVAGGLVIIYGFPRLTTAVPSPLICIIVLTTVSITMGLDTTLKTVGEMGELPTSLPSFLFPDIPWNWETFMIVLPYAIPMTVVGLLESLMTAGILDDFTDTESDKNRECKGQGISNLVAGFFGGMGGCAMIGQSVINVKSGGRGRLSTAASGIVLLILIFVLGDLVNQIPIAALVAVMLMVSFGTFNWSSIKGLRDNHRTSSVVMIATVAAVVFTHNLAIGVGIGVVLSALFFAYKVSRLLDIKSELDVSKKGRKYIVTGQLFFVSADRFADAFDFREVLDTITIDVTHAHFWDLSAVGALDRVVLKFRREGTEVDIVGMNEASKTLVLKIATHDKPGAMDEAGGH
ncbi:MULTISPECIES: SulP family inorganic anion transporter [unclassified Lentimonas]|uniref:SulP family inorganic anion transporter n=1 Tax=unclassified Lentimonas TaxID=2630993 RepID=UPI001324AEE5|nr:MULTISPECIES: SulP family inorganic anion transporter [unclassified Lentimonas]CAA6677905.1 Sulfate permease [Lentimonas sp. CC4]CAA6684009.1 Sulfate permease [Lentimonas sp. CC6]CAA6689881.1 Sulfate permease [Lentimonas sp. CC10]CAA6697148.1 Sulfate permease [Lentimonas sp. CC19]CAA7069422.1 Sulfate permease [Lentimonas sp. CC11]